MRRADTFLSDTEAPTLHLHLTRTSNGVAYNVVRDYDSVHLFCGDRVQVRLFLRGYGAALAHPALIDLAETLDDETAGNDTLLDMAVAVTDCLMPTGGVRSRMHIQGGANSTNCGKEIGVSVRRESVVAPASISRYDNQCPHCIEVERARERTEGNEVPEDTPSLDPPWWEAR